MNFYEVREARAAEIVQTALALPLPEDDMEFGCEGVFDPWEMFPCFYGSYSAEFDEVALTVLRNIRDQEVRGESVAHEMFREYLCRQGLCDYGTSPRVCFPSMPMRPIWADLTAKWEAYAAMRWKATPPA